MRTFPYILTAVTCALLMGAATAPAQESPDSSAPPIPAYHSPLASQADNDQSEPAQGLSPDTRPLAGAQDLSIGVAPLTHSYWLPHASVTGTLDSNALDAQGNSGWTTWTSFSGGVDLHRNAGNSQLTLSYVGGGMFSNDGNAPTGIAQGLNFEDQLLYRRLTVSLFDDLSYLPEASFGFNGIGAGSGLGSPGLSAPFTPSQSILTARGQNLANSSLVQVNTLLSPRGSITLVGGYSFLHYFDVDLLDSGSANFQVGYNYQMTRKDTFSVSYLFSAFRYSNFNQSINSNAVQVSYGRRVTGRLAFQVGGGPEVTSFDGVTSGSGSSATSSINRVYWTLNSSLQYQLERASLGVSYNHGVTGGSGVLAGAVTDSLGASLGHTISRTTSASASFGFSRNSGLAGSGVPTSSYNYWFAGATLNHQLGRTMNINLSYQAQIQGSNSSFCIGSNCGTEIVRHLISVGLGWQARPMRF